MKIRNQLDATKRRVDSCFLLSGCEIYGFNSTVGALAEIWSLAAVNWDRYQAIFNPLDRDKRITKSQVFLMEEKLNIRTEYIAAKKFSFD